MKMQINLMVVYFVATFFLCTISAEAKDDECATAQTQVDMNACAFIEYRRVDAELNILYTEYQSRLDSQQRQQLKDVQRAWVKLRDLSCKFETSGVEGGSVHPLILNQCLKIKTLSRINELKALSVCEEGDLSCPAWK